MKTIKYFKKNVYGNILFYFAKESKVEASAFTQISGRKTMTESDMQALKSLGFKLIEVLPEA